MMCEGIKELEGKKFRRLTAAKRATFNMGVMRHLVFNLIRKESVSDYSVPRKQRKAFLYDDYREKVLGF